MMRGCRRIPLVAVLFAISVLGLGAQQMTKVAILDIEKVYTFYFRESRAVKDFQERQAEVAKEISRIDDEILKLENEKLEAESKSDVQKALNLDKQIFSKRQYREDYRRIKNQQLKKMSEDLHQSDQFLDELLEAINYVAESEGYSLVLNNSRQYKPFFFYYMKEIDITEKVIQELMRRAGKEIPGGG